MTLKMTLKMTLLLVLSFLLHTNLAQAQGGAIEMPSGDDPQPKKTTPVVGRKAAQKYMGQVPAEASKDSSKVKAKSSDDRDFTTSASKSANAHYLAVHIGSFLSDNEYQWGTKAADSNVGRINIGLTYRIGEWVNAADFDARVDYLSYNLADGHVAQIAFMPALMFPDASSHFPLYFGAAAGPGIFITQLHDESPLSLNYSLFAGVRFFDVIDRTGFFVEGGLKNLILLTSDGQFNGTYIAVGAVFNF